MLVTGEKVNTSARNQLSGIISAVQAGAVNSEVSLDIGGEQTVAAIITKDSAERLALATGMSAQALIKASSIMLAVE